MDCPACGSSVTLDVGPEQPLSASLTEVVLAAEADESVEITRDCWDCGWHEVRQLRVESIEMAEGNEAIIERAALIDEITDELVAIDRVATLEDILAEIRRGGPHDSATTDTGDDRTE